MAPDFTAESTSGSTVRLSDYRGTSAVLLAFFPAAFTSVCTLEMESFSEDFEQFAGKGVEILPISVDPVHTLREFQASIDMAGQLLSDKSRAISRTYGVLLPEPNVANRAYFLVDRDGIVRWAHVEVHGGHRRENSEILEQIEQLG